MTDHNAKKVALFLNSYEHYTHYNIKEIGNVIYIEQNTWPSVNENQGDQNEYWDIHSI